MSNMKKYQYTDGGLFTLTGADYIGFFNVLSGQAYVSKYNQTTKLGNVDNAQNVVTISDKFFNRLPTQPITLTYSLSDLSFQSNEYINNNSLNLKLEKAYSNFIDIYRGCFMASSKLPYNLNKVALLSATNTGTKFAWGAPHSGSTFVAAPSTYNLAITPKTKISYNPNIYSSNKTLILANSASLMVFKVNPDNNTFAFTFSSTFIETSTLSGYGSIKFVSIGGIATNNNNLYVTDSSRSCIYAYDMTSVLEEDRALGFKFNLFNIVDKVQGDFTTPSLIESSNNVVFVYDSSELMIHYFDKNFNKINSYKNGRFFAKSSPVSLTYNRLHDQLYVLTSDYKIVVLDNEANSTFINLDVYGYGLYETPRKIIFSNTYSDVFYLLTNQGIYKKFISTPERNIGSFSFVTGITGSNSPIYGDFLYDISTYDSLQNYDDIMLYGYNQFINYKEETLFNSLIK